MVGFLSPQQGNCLHRYDQLHDLPDTHPSLDTSVPDRVEAGKAWATDRRHPCNPRNVIDNCSGSFILESLRASDSQFQGVILGRDQDPGMNSSPAIVTHCSLQATAGMMSGLQKALMEL